MKIIKIEDRGSFVNLHTDLGIYLSIIDDEGWHLFPPSKAKAMHVDGRVKKIFSSLADVRSHVESIV